MEKVRIWIELATVDIESLAVATMLGSISFVTVRWLIQIGQINEAAYNLYWGAIGKSLLVALELLVAADIIRTVTLDAILSALVLVRTFLRWTLTVEVEGHWPWERGRRMAEDQTAGTVRPQIAESANAQTKA